MRCTTVTAGLPGKNGRLCESLRQRVTELSIRCMRKADEGFPEHLKTYTHSLQGNTLIYSLSGTHYASLSMPLPVTVASIMLLTPADAHSALRQKTRRQTGLHSVLLIAEFELTFTSLKPAVCLLCSLR